MHCTNCGRELPGDARFCGSCGTATAPAMPAVGSDAPAAPPAEAPAFIAAEPPVAPAAPAAASAPPPPPASPSPPSAPPAAPVPRIVKPLSEAPRGLIGAAWIAGIFGALSVLFGFIAYEESGTTLFGETIGKQSGYILWGIGAGAFWAMVAVFCLGLDRHLDRIARIMLTPAGDRPKADGNWAPPPVRPAAAPQPELPDHLKPVWERK